jgi:hypothetical protein
MFKARDEGLARQGLIIGWGRGNEEAGKKKGDDMSPGSLC